MVEALTTKNLEIGERCGELEATVADLESSVELSEELEMQQAEDIRELQVIASISCTNTPAVVMCSMCYYLRMWYRVDLTSDRFAEGLICPLHFFLVHPKLVSSAG